MHLHINKVSEQSRLSSHQRNDDEHQLTQVRVYIYEYM